MHVSRTIGPSGVCCQINIAVILFSKFRYRQNFGFFTVCTSANVAVQPLLSSSGSTWLSHIKETGISRCGFCFLTLKRSQSSLYKVTHGGGATGHCIQFGIQKKQEKILICESL